MNSTEYMRADGRLRGHTEARMIYSANPPEGMTIYAPGFLASLPTLSTGQADDLKLETAVGTLRYWLARCDESDGEPWQVHVERLADGRWEPLLSYREVV